MTDSAELNKLRWRCRRGTRELDEMLGRYLRRDYAQAGDIERKTFLSLLELEDAELIRYLLGEQPAQDSRLQDLLIRIRQSAD